MKYSRPGLDIWAIAEINHQLGSVWAVDILNSSGLIVDIIFPSMGRFTTKVHICALLSRVLFAVVKLNILITINDSKARRNVLDFITETVANVMLT
jgi:hypothetical protein